jgi:hypothetical protein
VNDSTEADFALSSLEPHTKEMSYLQCLNVMWRRRDGSKADEMYFLGTYLDFDLNPRVKDSLNFLP